MAAPLLSSATIGSMIRRTPVHFSFSPAASPSSLPAVLIHTAPAPFLQRRYNASFRRHGKAVEPPPPTDDGSSKAAAAAATAAATSTSPSPDTTASSSPSKVSGAEPTETLVSEILGAGTRPAEPLSPGLFSAAPSSSSSSSSSSSGSPPSLPPTAAPPTAPSGPPDGPMQLTLHSPGAPPPDTDADAADAGWPMHHFDSYTAATRLQEGGYTPAQAVLLMKSMRGQLATRLTAARAQLLSKSDVENEIYLFRAACSELGNEVKNHRRVADEQMRRERTHLQHELDIVSQSIGQEISGMNDAVKGMIGDRSMSRREEHKARESAIQQLNYKISILLTSDTKAEIETIRWILIRRAVLGIIFMAVISISLMRYTALARKQRQKDAADEKKRRDKQRALDAAAQTVANQAQGHVPSPAGFH